MHLSFRLVLSIKHLNRIPASFFFFIHLRHAQNIEIPFEQKFKDKENKTRKIRSAPDIIFSFELRTTYEKENKKRKEMLHGGSDCGPEKKIHEA